MKEAIQVKSLKIVYKLRWTKRTIHVYKLQLKFVKIK
jgi:hypothetical protein